MLFYLYTVFHLEYLFVLGNFNTKTTINALRNSKIKSGDRDVFSKNLAAGSETHEKPITKTIE